MNPNTSEIEIRQNLKSAGFKEKQIEDFIKCYKQSEEACEIKMLNRQRNQLLDEIHERQVCIDCLDYLQYQMKKDVK